MDVVGAQKKIEKIGKRKRRKKEAKDATAEGRYLKIRMGARTTGRRIYRKYLFRREVSPGYRRRQREEG